MATRDTWGGSWGSSWATSWTVTIPEPPTPTPEPFTGGGGGGGGGPLDMGMESPLLPRILIEEREPADRFKNERERKERLRKHIRIALEGPQAPEVRQTLEPEPSDSAKPLHERIEVEALSDEQIIRIGEYYRAALAYRAKLELQSAAEARQREIDEDDDEVMLLL